MKSAICVYPKARALIVLGTYHTIMAIRSPEDDLIAAADHFTQSYRVTRQEAELLPQDDELHVCYLDIALQRLRMVCLGHIKDALQILEQMRISLPQAMKIYHMGAFAYAASERFGENNLEGDDRGAPAVRAEDSSGHSARGDHSV
ncbi:uncharacterized protein C8Q71DRAFT_47315 [Rhodofomes roseus]|uniref:Uncharacterized protein n=1 Tax=Rhodofomes roseus TaxID=34475 RepID=A0ABQ8KG31_9APHY|nr:uncharacterized protein C8Q71DRAFT_47315 [Rhodofomes roseus]KAH9836542.1 hypothetical protein C8Q71DRAFT_47315 [Rhodofomes roseus]